VIVFTLTVQRYADGKAEGAAFTKRYCANGSALESMGKDAPLKDQEADEAVMTRGVGRKARELYLDLAYSLGMRRPNWTEY
jgi:hypothetical protein